LLSVIVKRGRDPKKFRCQIAQPGTKDITEILVDAQTARMISRKTESFRDQGESRGRQTAALTRFGNGGRVVNEEPGAGDRSLGKKRECMRR
jgi:hypothetical protein